MTCILISASFKVMVSFPSLRDDFKKDCKPFIRLDGCHLKGPFESVLLPVISLEANNRIFPIAIYVCEFKNT